MIQKRRRSSRRKRTVLLPLILILVVLAIIGACVLFFLHMRNEKEKPSEILKTYLSSIRVRRVMRKCLSLWTVEKCQRRISLPEIRISTKESDAQT